MLVAAAGSQEFAKERFNDKIYLKTTDDVKHIVDTSGVIIICLRARATCSGGTITAEAPAQCV